MQEGRPDTNEIMSERPLLNDIKDQYCLNVLVLFGAIILAVVVHDEIDVFISATGKVNQDGLIRRQLCGKLHSVGYSMAAFQSGDNPLDAG